MLRRSATRHTNATPYSEWYFDTEDHFLEACLRSLRVRQIGPNCFQQLAGIENGGERLMSTLIYPSPKPGATPTPMPTGADARVDQAIGKDLLCAQRCCDGEFCVYENVRSFSNEWAALVSDRQGPDARVRRAVRLEVTSKHLLRSRPFVIARYVIRRHHANFLVPLGLRMLDAAAGSRPPHWEHQRESVTVLDAFRDIVRHALVSLATDEVAAIQGDERSLHQLRVTIRTLRAAISIFHVPMGSKHRSRLRCRLRELSRRLGPARNLDVYKHDALATLTAAARRDPSARHAVRTFAAERRATLARLNKTLCSARYRLLALELVEVACTASVFQQAPHRQARSNALSAQDLLTREYRRRMRKICCAEKRFDRYDTHQLHRLRLRVKTARHCLEFLRMYSPSSAHGGQQADQLHRLRQLQDALGRLNDIAQNRSLTSRLFETPSKQRPPSISRTAQDLLRSFDQSEKSLRKKARVTLRKLRMTVVSCE